MRRCWERSANRHATLPMQVYSHESARVKSGRAGEKGDESNNRTNGRVSGCGMPIIGLIPFFAAPRKGLSPIIDERPRVRLRYADYWTYPLFASRHIVILNAKKGISPIVVNTNWRGGHNRLQLDSSPFSPSHSKPRPAPPRSRRSRRRPARGACCRPPPFAARSPNPRSARRPPRLASARAPAG